MSQEANLTILVCDDRERHARDYAARLEEAVPKGVVVGCSTGEPLGKELIKLRQRARSYLQGRDPKDEQTIFDTCDVCLIDNSLLMLDAGTADGAESLFGLVRAFTRCELLVSINLDPFTDFDLRLLGGHPETNADLALNERHLDLKSVWSPKGDPFSPWYWPRIEAVLANREARRRSIRESKSGLDTAIWSFFGFDQGARADGLRDNALGYLDPHAPRGAHVETTFRDFFNRAARSLPAKAADREQLEGRDDIILKVVEAELSRWLQQMVVATQSTLVDLPHLVSRLPVFMPAPRGDLAKWDRLTEASSGDEPFGLDEELFAQHLQGAWFNSASVESLKCWGDRPLFWWPDLRDNRPLAELDLQATDAPDYAFLEDQSRFADRVKEPDIRRFTAAFHSSWDTRFVSSGLDDFEYAPRTRLMD